MSGVNIGDALLLALELKYEGDVAIGKANIVLPVSESIQILLMQWTAKLKKWPKPVRSLM